MMMMMITTGTRKVKPIWFNEARDEERVGTGWAKGEGNLEIKYNKDKLKDLEVRDSTQPVANCMYLFRVYTRDDHGNGIPSGNANPTEISRECE